jgi:ABC-type phosphonate transport system ATPase subunit
MTKAKIDPVLANADVLEHALAAKTVGREGEWSKIAMRVLRQVEETLRCHLNDLDADERLLSTDGNAPEGTFPTRDRHFLEIRREAQVCLDSVQALEEKVQHAFSAFETGSKQRQGASPAEMGIPDFGEIRADGGQVISALRHFRDEEAKELLESVTTDIGVGD